MGFTQVEVGLIPEAEIDPGGQGLGAGFSQVPGSPVFAVFRVAQGEFINGQRIPHHKARKAPALAEDLGQQVRISGDRHPVDIVVGAHHGVGTGLHAALKGRQVVVVQFPRPHVGGGGVAAPFGGAVGGKVFEGGDDRVRVVQSRPLQSLDVGGPEFPP